MLTLKMTTVYDHSQIAGPDGDNERLGIRSTIKGNEWISKAEGLRFLNFFPIDNAIALKSVNLPSPPHSDPADRIIIASALVLDALLITKDEKILSYPFFNAAW